MLYKQHLDITQTGQESTTDCLQMGAVEGNDQNVRFIFTGGAVGVRGLGLANMLLGGRLQSVLGQVFAAGAEGMVEGGGEAGNICGYVRKHLWRRLVIVTDLETK